jgi:hypothetical protein
VEFVESTLFIAFSYDFGHFNICLRLQTTFLISFESSFAEFDSGNGIVEAHADNIEDHEECCVHVNSNPNDKKIVKQMTVRSKSVKQRPPFNPLIRTIV